MMFDKDNTNTGGECLCDSCVFALSLPKDKYSCLIDNKDHKKVGVCKYYSHFNESEVFNG